MTTPNTFATANGLANFNRGTKAYKLAMEAIEFPGVKVSTCYTSGSGRFTSNQDHHSATANILTKLGVLFTQDNDAPRGGKTGQWVMVAEGTTLDWMEQMKQEKAEAQAKAAAKREAWEAQANAAKAAVMEEADSITVDEQFIADVKAASLLSGVEKSNRSASAFKALLERNGIEKIESDFWTVYRRVKSSIK